MSLNGEYTPLARLAKIGYTHGSMRTATSALLKMKTTAIVGKEGMVVTQTSCQFRVVWSRLERWSTFCGNGMVMVIFSQRWNGDGF